MASSCSSANDSPKPEIDNTVKLIYDGDVAPDPCDFATLSMLHEYHKREMIDLVGVIGATPDPYIGSTLGIYNQLYDHNIPIGAFSEGSDNVELPDGRDEIRRTFQDSPYCFMRNASVVAHKLTRTADQQRASPGLLQRHPYAQGDIRCARAEFRHYVPAAYHDPFHHAGN